jgi:hypothetical protein
MRPPFLLNPWIRSVLSRGLFLSCKGSHKNPGERSAMKDDSGFVLRSLDSNIQARKIDKPTMTYNGTIHGPPFIMVYRYDNEMIR